MMSIKGFMRLLQAAFRQWQADKASRMAAALAFYTALSLAPLLILAVAVAGFLYSSQTTQAQLLAQVENTLGRSGAELFKTVLDNAAATGSGVIASVLSVLMLVLGASGVFGELQEAMNQVWKVSAETSSGLQSMVRSRLLSFGMVLSIGFLLIVSIIVSLILSFITSFVSQLSPLAQTLLPVINQALSLIIFMGLFGLLYKILPRTHVAWRDVWPGAAVTSLLFLLGKFLLKFYLEQGSVGSTYGAASSLVLVLVWVYYSAQIFLLGAEFVHEYARQYGSLRPLPVPPAATLVRYAPIPAASVVARTPSPAPGWGWSQAVGAFVALMVGIIIGARDTRR